MFSLFCGAYEYVTRKPEYRILMVGIDEVGKTSFLEHAKKVYKPSHNPLKYPTYLPTTGLNLGRFETSSKKILLWDLGGKRNLRNIWRKYYKEADALIFVMDPRTERWEEAKACFEDAKKGVGRCPVLLVANKIDLFESAHYLEDIMELLHIQEYENGITFHAFADVNPIKIFPTCAFSGEGIEQAMTWLVDEL